MKMAQLFEMPIQHGFVGAVQTDKKGLYVPPGVCIGEIWRGDFGAAIVHAVNQHDDLVSLLDKCAAQFESDSVKLNLSVHGRKLAALAVELRAALAKETK